MDEGSSYVVQDTPFGLRYDHAVSNTQTHTKELEPNTSAFIDGFFNASDPRGFLILAGVPIFADGGDGASLTLLRVETVTTTDISHLASEPGDDGSSFATVPARFAGGRSTVSLIYYDGTRLVPLTLAEARSLA